jgi:hypothetical protein
VAAWLGIAVAGVELVTAFPYFAAIGRVVDSDVSTGQKLVLLALYNADRVAPAAEVAPRLHAVGPSHAPPRTTKALR